MSTEKDCGLGDAENECEWCVGDGWLMGEPDHYERGTDAWVPCECNPDELDPFPPRTENVEEPS